MERFKILFDGAKEICDCEDLLTINEINEESNEIKKLSAFILENEEEKEYHFYTHC